MVEEIIISHLSVHKKGYIRPMYKSLEIKKSGLSLNKFRMLLKSMEKQGKLIEVQKDYPYWELSV